VPQDARRTQLAYASLLVVQVLFGLFPVATKQVYHSSSVAPLSILAVRVFGGALVLALVHPLLVRQHVPVRKELPRLAGLTLLGVVLNMGLFLIGLSQTDPVEAVLVLTTIPVFTYAIAVVLGREPLGPKRALGIALSMLGVVYLVAHSLATDRAHAVGDLLVAANALSFAAFLVLSKPLMSRMDPLAVTTWMFALGSVVALPVAVAGGLVQQLRTVPRADVLWLAFIVLGPTVLTYVLNARALRHVPSSVVAAFTYVQPLVTAVAAAVILDQWLDWRLAPAAVLVFFGLWLVARRRPAVLEGQTVSE